MTGKSKKPAYQESKDHVPNPMHQTGVVDTTGTTGDAGARIENISPVFAQAKADAFAEAIDDLDHGDGEFVVLPGDGDVTREEAIENLREAAAAAAKDPQLTRSQPPGAAEAAEAENKSHAPRRTSDTSSKTSDK